jgi:hypothetical protein
VNRRVEALWAQKFESHGVAIDMVDVHMHHTGAANVISQVIYQSDKDDKWIASVRYWVDMA